MRGKRWQGQSGLASGWGRWFKAGHQAQGGWVLGVVCACSARSLVGPSWVSRSLLQPTQSPVLKQALHAEGERHVQL